MAQKGLTAGSISNNISHIRTYYKMANIDAAPLHHYRVNLALRAVAISIRKAPNLKDAVPPQVVRAVLTRNQGSEEAELVALAILILYIGFLRQSSLAPATRAAFDPTRHPSVADAALGPKGLTLQLKWSKTMQRATDATSLILPPTMDPTMCPVKAYTKYMAKRAHHGPRAPLLTFKDGNPLTSRYLARRWAALLVSVGSDPKLYSLHSLRKGGASYAYNQGGARLNDVMTQGTWRSMAVRHYIKPKDGQTNTVHRALARL